MIERGGGRMSSEERRGEIKSTRGIGPDLVKSDRGKVELPSTVTHPVERGTSTRQKSPWEGSSLSVIGLVLKDSDSFPPLPPEEPGIIKRLIYRITRRRI